MTLVRRIGIVAAMVLVLLHPGFGSARVTTRATDLQVLVAVDRTRSMAALDHDGRHPRIDGVRQDLRSLADALPGARFALMTFGFDARLELPFTTDTNAFLTELDTLELERPTAGTGSSLDRPKQDLIEVLSHAQTQYPDRRTVLVVVSDGENTSQVPPTSMADVAPYVQGGAVLGYGTTRGGPMPNAQDLSASDGFVIDPKTHRTAISHEDPQALRTLAQQLGVPFVQRDRAGGMAAIAHDFGSGTVEAPGPSGTRAHDLTWLFALLLLGLVLLELREGWRAAWAGRRELR
jgi:Ca-activated chloride channel family protein